MIWLSQMFTWVVKKCLNLTFKVIFSCQKSFQSLFFKLKNINLEEDFLLLSFFENFKFWTTLFSKMVPNFWQSDKPDRIECRWKWHKLVQSLSQELPNCAIHFYGTTYMYDKKSNCNAQKENSPVFIQSNKIAHCDHENPSWHLRCCWIASKLILRSLL